MISIGLGDSITLNGVDQDSLVAGDFQFNQVPITIDAGSMLIGDGATLPLDGTIDNAGIPSR